MRVVKSTVLFFIDFFQLLFEIIQTRKGKFWPKYLKKMPLTYILSNLLFFFSPYYFDFILLFKLKLFLKKKKKKSRDCGKKIRFARMDWHLANECALREGLEENAITPYASRDDYDEED
jgi:hypothetical protein